MENEFNWVQPGSNDEPGWTFGGTFQPGSRIFQPGLNPGDFGGKSNPGYHFMRYIAM